jgi:hypothetical protein
MMDERGSEKNPLVMKLQAADADAGRMILMAILTIAPVAIAVLMQNPALRQKISMQVWSIAERLAGQGKRTMANVESIAKTRYDIARL